MTNKIALVTGGSRGLGKNTALKLAERGFDVVLTYRSKKQEAESVVSEIEKKGRVAAALQLDTGEISSFDDFFGQLKSILRQKWQRNTFDFLINNAGIEAHGLITETSEATFDSLFNVHFKGVYF